MSVTVLTDVLWSKITPAAVKWTLSVMADRVNDEGRGFFYSVPTLALITGQSERTVQRHLQLLLAWKLKGAPHALIVEDVPAGHHYAAEYRIDVDALRALPQIGRPKPKHRGDKMAPLPKARGDKSNTPGVTTGTARGDNGDSAPISNPTTHPTTDPPTPAPVGAGGVAGGFDVFWQAYPRKKNKGDAEKVWKQLKPSQALQTAMLAAIAWQRETWDWRKSNGAYIPHPAKWLRAKGWEDERPQSDRGGGRDDRPTEAAKPCALKCGKPAGDSQMAGIGAVCDECRANLLQHGRAWRPMQSTSEAGVA